MEALICFAAFLAIISLCIGIISQHKMQMEAAADAVVAEAQAQHCAVAVNALFSNGVKTISSTAENCYPYEEGEIASGNQGEQKRASTIAHEIKLLQIGNKQLLEVTGNEHYR